jgi:starch synthase
MSALIPIYIKTAYREEPSFRDSRVVYSMYKDDFHNNLKENFTQQLLIKDMTDNLLEGIQKPVNASELNKLAIQYSDGLIQGDPDIYPELLEYAEGLGIPTLTYQGEENYAESFCNFYDQIWSVGKEEEEEEED